MSKLTNIIDGWLADIGAKSFNIEEATRRAQICAECPHNQEVLKLSLCEKCGCLLSKKTKAMQAECPIGKWGKYEDKS